MYLLNHEMEGWMYLLMDGCMNILNHEIDVWMYLVNQENLLRSHLGVSGAYRGALSPTESMELLQKTRLLGHCHAMGT